MADPKISVVMPVYNAGAYLEEAVESVLTQNFTDFELISIDDGSTDSSYEVLARYAAADPRVRIIRQDNNGVTAALNTGLAEAKGVLLARMDADDIAAPARFARQVAYLDAHPETIALGTQTRLIDPDGRVLREMRNPTDHEVLDAEHASGASMSLICHPTVMMRTDAVRAVGGYDETFPAAQDIDLFLKLAEIGRIGNLDEVLLDYRQHHGSVGYAKRAGQRKAAWTAARNAAARRAVSFEIEPPGQDTNLVTTADVYRKWGWWAFMSGEVATARFYARRSMRLAPLDPESWRLAFVSLRGR